MKKLILVLFFVLPFSANAALITSVNKFVNDGVFLITPGQAAYLGVDGADALGYLRLRQGSGISWGAGDVINRDTIFNSTSQDSLIVDILNGVDTLPWNNVSVLNYETGGIFDKFTSAEILVSTDFWRGIIIAFDSNNSITFRNATLSSARNRGFVSTEIIPEVEVSAPQTIGLMLVGIVALFFRKKKYSN